MPNKKKKINIWINHQSFLSDRVLRIPNVGHVIVELLYGNVEK